MDNHPQLAIAYLPYGTRIQVINKDRNFYKVSAKGQIGWVKTDFIEEAR